MPLHFPSLLFYSISDYLDLYTLGCLSLCNKDLHEFGCCKVQKIYDETMMMEAQRLMLVFGCNDRTDNRFLMNIAFDTGDLHIFKWFLGYCRKGGRKFNVAKDGCAVFINALCSSLNPRRMKIIKWMVDEWSDVLTETVLFRGDWLYRIAFLGTLVSLDIVKLLAEKYPSLRDQFKNFLATILTLAARTGDIEEGKWAVYYFQIPQSAFDECEDRWGESNVILDYLQKLKSHIWPAPVALNQ